MSEKKDAQQWTPTMSLGELIREARDRKGMSRVKLSQFTGISQNSLVKYEKAGQRDGKYPSLMKMAQISEVLEIDPRWTFEMLIRSGDLKIERQFSFYFNFRDDRELNILKTATDIALIPTVFEHILEGQQEEIRAFLRTLTENIKQYAETYMQNGSDRKDPSRSENLTNTPEAVDAASISQDKRSDR